MDEPTNYHRAARAKKVVERYGDWDPVERETTLTDLLADLMHLARLSKLNWDDILRRAEGHHYEEMKENPDSPKDWSPLI
jgi:hypothetical protein